MNIKGHIVDSTSKQGITRASVTVVDESGAYLGQGVIADDGGNFGLQSNLIDNNFLLVTSEGYSSAIVDPALFGTARYEIDLDKDFTTLDPVVVTPNSNKKDYSWIWLLVGAGTITAIAYADHKNDKKKQRRIGEAGGGFDYSKLVIPVAVVGLGAAVLIPLFQKLGLLDTAQDKAKAAAQSQAAKDQQAAAAAVTGQRGFSDSDLKSMTSQITDATNHTLYNYDKLVTLLAYWAGFYHADAVKFLGFFVDANAQTVYQWYLDKFVNSSNFSTTALWSLINWGDPDSGNQDTTANFTNMGIDVRFFLGADEWASGCVKYLYKVSGISMQ